MLILDLDHTIFDTQTIGEEAVKPLINRIRQLLEAHLGKLTTDALIQDLWKRPFDQVMEKYAISLSIQEELIAQINQCVFDFDITVFEDYPYLLELQMDQILVTTGFTQLQEAKINALGIAQDFQEIHIDDPTDQQRIYKIGIFEGIQAKHPNTNNDIWVIGDSPESELKAGKALGLKTIQRLAKGETKSPYSDFGIHSFKELKAILDRAS